MSDPLIKVARAWLAATDAADEDEPLIHDFYVRVGAAWGQGNYYRRFKEALNGSPPASFFIDTPGIECRVYTDPSMEVRGKVGLTYEHERAIFLREYDETVLLHEVLHRIFELQNETPMTQEQEEVLVGRIEKTLFAMGWRWTENRPWEAEG